jgi:hypothetical protein
MVRRRFPSSSAAGFVLYHLNSNFVSVKSTFFGPQGKTRAEAREKHYCCVKISTQMLISMWKSLVRAALTSHPSTLFSALHHFCATVLFLTHTHSA